MCTRLNRHTLDPSVKRGIMLERRSVLFAFALPSVRGTTACHLAICRETFSHLPTVRPFKPSGLPVPILYHVPLWLNIYFCCKHMDKTRKNYRFLKNSDISLKIIFWQVVGFLAGIRIKYNI